MTFKAGYLYPLRDKTRFDDAHGAGFDHALIPSEAEPGPLCIIHDAWAVNARGEYHPGYDAVPVPINRADVILSRGRPFGEQTREPMRAFWR